MKLLATKNLAILNLLESNLLLFNLWDDFRIHSSTHKSTSKAHLNLNISPSKSLHKTWFNKDSTNVQPFGLISLSSMSRMTFNDLIQIHESNLQPNESTSKAMLNPQVYFQRQLASMGKLEPGEQTVVKIQPLWNQLVCLQLWNDIQCQSSNPLSTSKAIFNPIKVLSETVNF